MYVALLLVSLLLLGIRLRFFARHRPWPKNPKPAYVRDGDYTVPLRTRVDSEGGVSGVKRLGSKSRQELPISVVNLAITATGELGLMETAISHNTRGLPMLLTDERFGRPIPHDEDIDVVISVTGGILEVKSIDTVAAQPASDRPVTII